VLAPKARVGRWRADLDDELDVENLVARLLCALGEFVQAGGDQPAQGAAVALRAHGEAAGQALADAGLAANEQRHDAERYENPGR
jgi:hypothetical protein